MYLLAAMSNCSFSGLLSLSRIDLWFQIINLLDCISFESADWHSCTCTVLAHSLCSLALVTATLSLPWLQPSSRIPAGLVSFVHPSLHTVLFPFNAHARPHWEIACVFSGQLHLAKFCGGQTDNQYGISSVAACIYAHLAIRALPLAAGMASAKS